MTLYETLKEAGAEIGSHCSDLQVKSTPKVESIVKQFCTPPADGSYWHGYPRPTRFNSRIDGALWIEVSFAFDPYWLTRGQS